MKSGGSGLHGFVTLTAAPNAAGGFPGTQPPIFCPAQSIGPAGATVYTIAVTNVPVLSTTTPGTTFIQAGIAPDGLDKTVGDMTGAAVTASIPYVFMPSTAQFNRAGGLIDLVADGIAGSVFGSLASVASVPWFRQAGTYLQGHGIGDDSDNQANEVFGTQGVVARMQAINNAGNGTSSNSWDRWRNNAESIQLNSAARTASTNGTDQVNYNWRGLHLFINVTVVPGGGQTLEVHIQGKDFSSGLYYDILVGTLISATGITVLKVYPGIGALAGGAAPDILPRTWRVSMVHSGAGSWTYSVTANLVV